MNYSKLIGVRRAGRFSPNQTDNDATIFNKVAHKLQALGHEVDMFSEEDFLLQPISAVPVFTMARDTATLTRLRTLEDRHIPVINSPRGIENCARSTQTRLFATTGIPCPESKIISTGETIPTLPYPCWVKRDGPTETRADVTFAQHAAEAQAALDALHRRGIPTALISTHLEGDLVKFYGVMHSSFFHWFYPHTSHSKFGLETANGEPQGIPFRIEEFRHMANKAAALLGVPIYGGDAVVSSDNTIRIIDFNDWPSFSPCRETAAKAIANFIHKTAENFYSHV